MAKNTDYFKEWLNEISDDGRYSAPIFWDSFKFMLRGFIKGAIAQPLLTIISVCGVLTAPWMVSNFAGGVTARQVDFNQPSPGIIAGQVGSFTRNVIDTGSYATNATVQYVSTQQQSPTLTPMQNNRLHQQQWRPPQTQTLMTNGMGQY